MSILKFHIIFVEITANKKSVNKIRSKEMKEETYRSELASVANIFTFVGYNKQKNANKIADEISPLFVNRRVEKDTLQVNAERTSLKYSYVIVPKATNKIIPGYLAFLMNTTPWKVLLANSGEFFKGTLSPISIKALKKLLIVLIPFEEQEACALLNTIISFQYDDVGEKKNFPSNIKLAYEYFENIADIISLEIFLGDFEGNADISVLSAWIEKSKIYKETPNVKQGIMNLLDSIFSSNDILRGRMNKMRMYIDEHANAIFNHFPK